MMNDLVSLVVRHAAIIRIHAHIGSVPEPRPRPLEVLPSTTSAGSCLRRSVASQLRLRSPASLKESEMMRLGKQYRVVREVCPCNLALWLSLALLLFGLAIPGSFQCRRDQLRKVSRMRVSGRAKLCGAAAASACAVTEGTMAG
jgi:hypothetical protein